MTLILLYSHDAKKGKKGRQLSESRRELQQLLLPGLHHRDHHHHHHLVACIVIVSVTDHDHDQEQSLLFV